MTLSLATINRLKNGYQILSAQDQAVLQFLAVMAYTDGYYKESALTKFIQTEKSLFDLKNGHIHIKNLIKKLKDNHYINKSNNITPEILNFLSIEAFKSKTLSSYMIAQAQSIEYMKIEQLRYKTRNAIYLNNFNEFCEAKLALPDSEFFSNYLPDFFNTPIDPDWFKSLSKELQAALLHEMILVKYVFSKNTFDEIITYFIGIRLENGNEAIDQALAIYDIFQLDISKNHQIVSYTDQFNHAAKCLLNKSTSQTSDEEFIQSIINFKKLTKKRTFLLDLPYTILMMLSLMSNGHRKNTELITTTIKNEQKATRAVTIFRHFENILWHLQGFKSRTPNTVDTNIERFYPFYATFTALFIYWYEPKKLNLTTLEILFKKIESVPLLGKIIAEILWKQTNQKNYKDYLNNPKFTDIIEFTNLISFEDSWSATIDSLEGFFQGKTQPVESKTKRLVWNFDVKTKEISPLEQSLGAKGWTKGKAISLKRLVTEPLDFLSVSDQKIIDTISAERSYQGQAYNFDKVESLLALANHPYVFEVNSGIQLEFYVCEPELNIRQDGDNFLIELSHNSEIEAVILEKISESRYNMVHFKKTLLPLLEIIGKGIKVPEKGKDRIVSVIKKIGGQIPIHSDIETQDIKIVASDPKIIAQLTPLNAGLKVQFLVRPFSNHGPYFKVGNGRELVQVFENNEPIKTHRSFAKELEFANAVVSDSNYLKNNDDGSFEWELDNPTDCLEVLGDLKQFNNEEQMIIEWPQGEKFKISHTVDFKNFSLSIRQQRDWFSLDGSISFDNDTVMDLKTFMGLLAKSEGNFIKLDEQKYLKLTSSLRKQLHELSIIADTKNGDYRFNALSAHNLKHFTEQVAEVKSDENWRELINLFAEAEKFTPKLPSTFEANLREYQEEGFDWLSRLAFMKMGACLADDMGLGKTVQTLAVLVDKAKNGPCIVVAPTSICYNWHAEILKFAPTLTSYNLDSSNRAEVVNNLGKMDILICSYTLLQQEINILKDKKWSMVVLDEAQAIKNSTTKRFHAAIQLEGEFKVALSGTPIENGIEEIWSIFRFITPGLLGSKESFQKCFLTAEKASDKRQALKNLIKPFILRRTKSAVLQELPPKTEQTLYIEMEPEEAAFYEALRQNAIENIASMGTEKSGQRKLHILAEITKLRRACCHPKLVMPVNTQSSKLKAFIELVIELLANNHKALVFSQYVGYLDIVKQELDKHQVTYQYLDGSTPGHERQKRVNDFQEGKSSLFLLSLKAGGSGLNLTAADYVIHLDPWWNPAVEDQASDRIYRIGQQRPVTIYRLIMKSSIEEKILSMHHDKRALADDLLDGTNTASKLSEEDLIGLLNAA